MRSAVVLIVCGLVLGASPASAQNTSFTTAQNIMPGQPPLQFTMTLNFPSEFTYYLFRVVAGRSYCAEITGGPAETTRVVLAGMFVFRADQTTEVALSNGLTVEEPLSGDGPFADSGAARSCWIAPASERNYVRAHKSFFAAAGAITYQIRVVETTLFSNWFFVGFDYSAYTLLRNTTSTELTYVLNYRNASGTIVATESGTIPGNGLVFRDARTLPGALAAAVGTVEVAHTGSPDAIAASTTVISPTTGLSFDAPFVKRTTW